MKFICALADFCTVESMVLGLNGLGSRDWVLGFRGWGRRSGVGILRFWFRVWGLRRTSLIGFLFQTRPLEMTRRFRSLGKKVMKGPYVLASDAMMLDFSNKPPKKARRSSALSKE